MVTWGNEPALPRELTDDEILAITMRTMRRYKALGIGVSSWLAAEKMRRLYARRVVAS